jgi:hypothetical protein
MLVAAMAEECRQRLAAAAETGANVPLALHKSHLLAMCDTIVEHAETGDPLKLHRWLGFIQAALIANGTLDLEQVKTMFDAAKNAYGVASDDLIDHLDATNLFEVDIGGES